MTISNSIFVYNGQGADSVCIEQTVQKLANKYGKNYSILQVDGSHLAKINELPVLYVLPGGQAGEMGKGLSQTARKIQECVSKGSGMLAFCAGGMVACSAWHYFVPTHKPPYAIGRSCTDLNSLLDLEIYSFGPAIYDSKYPFDDYVGANDNVACLTEVYISSAKKSCKCYWNKGPGFSLDSNQDSLGQYTSSINPLIIQQQMTEAAIHSSYGKGNVVALGVHPELAEWSQSKGFSLSESDLQLNNHLFETSCKLAGLHI